MAIKLRVISDNHRELGENRSRIFGVNGGSVGRAPDNDWVLPDARRVVSGHHFVVQYHGGKYWLNDISTNGVYVNDADDPVSMVGRCELRDGDRLRLGDYEITVNVDSRMDFLPATADDQSAARHLDGDIGSSIKFDNLLRPVDASTSGSLPVHNAFGVKVGSEARAALRKALSAEAAGTTSALDDLEPATGAEAQQGGPEWALRTRQITREELGDALARRQSRAEARERAAPFYQQASTWADLKSATQALCRGAGVDPESLSPEAQAMLPLVAGQLLREVVVGLTDIALARANGPAGARIAALPAPPGGGSNPLRTSTSVEQAVQRLFESHNRLYAGPVDSMRDVLQETKEHEAALAAGMRAGLAAVLEQLSPSNIADQFEQGRARTLAPGQDPRPKYWEHYTEFFRLLKQQSGPDELPHPFVEAFGQEYTRSRAQLRSRRS